MGNSSSQLLCLLKCADGFSTGLRLSKCCQKAACKRARSSTVKQGLRALRRWQRVRVARVSSALEGKTVVRRECVNIKSLKTVTTSTDFAGDTTGRPPPTS